MAEGIHPLMKKLKEAQTELKKRGHKLTKDEFFDSVFEALDEDFYKSQVIEKYSPKEFFINEALKNEDFKEEVFKILKERGECTT